MVQVQTPPGHGGLGPVDHQELLVLSWGQHVYSTKTLACVTVPSVGCIKQADALVYYSSVLALIH